MVEGNKKEKSWIVTILLCLFFGMFGIHRFYIGKNKSAIIQLLTLGGIGIWYLIDLIIIANQKFQDLNGNEIKEENKKNLNVIFIVCTIVAIINTFAIINGINIMDNIARKLRKNEEFFNNIEANMQVFMDLNVTLEEEE